ncbi:hypothetical protein EVAR_27872_1 [Eumeta japonica]|uniref:Uncharacterized protein n=1 Tax=Eumeta variegata TaxID=151549 RepID=A0A4C1VLD9_EUMVA|nr:hypothetical protein EVAR_27872_1 [Eumeta japonica]
MAAVGRRKIIRIVTSRQRLAPSVATNKAAVFLRIARARAAGNAVTRLAPAARLNKRRRCESAPPINGARAARPPLMGRRSARASGEARQLRRCLYLHPATIYYSPRRGGALRRTHYAARAGGHCSQWCAPGGCTILSGCRDIPLTPWRVPGPRPPAPAPRAPRTRRKRRYTCHFTSITSRRIRASAHPPAADVLRNASLGSLSRFKAPYHKVP